MAQTATKTKTTKSSPKAQDKVKQTGRKAATKDEVVEPKCANAKVQKAKPQAKMLRVISKKGNHPGKALRIKRWDRYETGMTLQHCKETEGLDHLDVLFYVEHGLMELRDPTQKEVDAAVAAWEAAQKKDS